MGLSLYDVSVANYLQGLSGVIGFMEKGRVHCEAEGIDLAEIVETRLFPNMLPFRFQIVSVAHHSAGAIESLSAGAFSPSGAVGDLDYAALQQLVLDAKKRLEDIKADDVNAYEGNDMAFKMGERSIPFTAETFLLSFSLPNFYFHATTAYDILRMKGTPIGKADFMGRLRMKRPD